MSIFIGKVAYSFNDSALRDTRFIESIDRYSLGEIMALMELYEAILTSLNPEEIYENIYKLSGNNFVALPNFEQMSIRKYRTLIKVHNKVQTSLEQSRE